MNTWNTLHTKSYQQRVYENILATVKRQIPQVWNPTPAEFISREAALDGNVVLPDYLTSEVVLEDKEFGSTDCNNRIDNNCTDDRLCISIPGGSQDLMMRSKWTERCHLHPQPVTRHDN